MKVWPCLIVAFVQDRLGHANIQNTIVVYIFYTTATRDA